MIYIYIHISTDIICDETKNLVSYPYWVNDDIAFTHTLVCIYDHIYIFIFIYMYISKFYCNAGAAYWFQWRL